MGRLLMSNPDFQTGFLRYICRDISPAEFNALNRQIPRIIIQSLVSGMRNRSQAASV
jgi:hypothetical protein